MIKRVGIVGSGIMGSGIAEVAAKAGHRGRAAVAAQQATADAMVAGAREVAGQAGRAGQARRRPSATPSLGRVTRHVADLGDLADCDLVIESVVEDLAVKKAPVHRARPHRAGRAPSSPPTRRRCPVVELAMETGRPDQVVRRPLLQPGADDGAGRDRPPAHRERRDDRRGHAPSPTACGKNPVEVQGPGRLHRQRAAVPVPQQRGAHARERRRASRDDIDTAMKGGCNFPMGPLALLDLVGLDTCLSHPRRALRRVPRPELRRRAAAAPHGHRRPARPQVRPGLLRLPRSRRRGDRRSQRGRAPLRGARLRAGRPAPARRTRVRRRAGTMQVPALRRGPHPCRAHRPAWARPHRRCRRPDHLHAHPRRHIACIEASTSRARTSWVGATAGSSPCRWRSPGPTSSGGS